MATHLTQRENLENRYETPKINLVFEVSSKDFKSLDFLLLNNEKNIHTIFVVVVAGMNNCIQPISLHLLICQLSYALKVSKSYFLIVKAFTKCHINPIKTYSDLLGSGRLGKLLILK
jgi:hypothetical protein